MACGLRRLSSRTPEPHGLVGSTSRVTFKFGISIVKYPCRPSSSTPEVGSLGESRCSSIKELTRNELRFLSREKGQGGMNEQLQEELPSVVKTRVATPGPYELPLLARTRSKALPYGKTTKTMLPGRNPAPIRNSEPETFVSKCRALSGAVSGKRFQRMLPSLVWYTQP
jgi:hypothetical protein